MGSVRRDKEWRKPQIAFSPFPSGLRYSLSPSSNITRLDTQVNCKQKRKEKNCYGIQTFDLLTQPFIYSLSTGAERPWSVPVGLISQWVKQTAELWVRIPFEPERKPMAELKVIIVYDCKGYFLGEGWLVLGSLILGLGLCWLTHEHTVNINSLYSYLCILFLCHEYTTTNNSHYPVQSKFDYNSLYIYGLFFSSHFFFRRNLHRFPFISLICIPWF